MENLKLMGSVACLSWEYNITDWFGSKLFEKIKLLGNGGGENLKDESGHLHCLSREHKVTQFQV